MTSSTARSIGRLLLLCLLAAALTLGVACHSGVRGSRLPPTDAQPRGSAAPYAGPMFAAHRMSPELSSLLASPVLSPEEELWIIERSPRAASDPARADDLPRTGSLVCNVPDIVTPVAVPLEHTDVRASIAGFIATTDVTQRFHNPFDTKVEAVYVFPLPETAAISEFVMTVGDRRIRGVLREREQAQQLYHEARAAGHVASLMTQERPNIFTQSVANIEPGRRIDVSIRYYHTLAYDDGWFEYVFPMVVGPRFNPPGSADGVGAVPRTRAGAPGQPTEVPYLAPGERSGHDISLAVSLDAAVRADDIRCTTHRTHIERLSDSRALVRLAQDDSIPNKDFVLRYRVAGESPRSAFIAHRAGRGGEGDEGCFALMVIPPAAPQSAPRSPVEMIFVLDCSGSMAGGPLAQAKAAVAHALSLLTPRDTFQIIRFSESSSAMGAAPLPATPENLLRGRQYLDSLSSEGGTMMIEGIRAALLAPHDETRLRYVTFLTDGYIGNEAEILTEMRRLLGTARVFSFGVGSSPNRFLMDRMAKLGRGAAAYLAPGDDAADVMDRFFARASRPALTDVRVDWGGLEVMDVHPSSLDAGDEGRLPDLLPGRPLILTGRFRGRLPQRITLHGRSGGSDARIPVALGEDSLTTDAAALGQLWARHRIAHLTDRALAGAIRVPDEQIRRIALAHGVLCGLTAFVAVDAASRAAGEHGVTLPVPVPVPDGVRYDAAVARPIDGGASR